MSNTPFSDSAWNSHGEEGDVSSSLYELSKNMEKLLRESHRFLFAQAYTREEIDDFGKRLNDFLGIPNDR